MRTQYELKVWPQGHYYDCFRTFAIQGSETLNRLCDVICEEFDLRRNYWSDEYMFRMSAEPYAGENVEEYWSNPNEHVPRYVKVQKSTLWKLDEIELTKGQKFLLRYGYNVFGACREFVVSVRKITEMKCYNFPYNIKKKGQLEQKPKKESAKQTA